MRHEIKLEKNHFNVLLKGAKHFHAVASDEKFEVGDIVTFVEVDKGVTTNKKCRAEVTCVKNLKVKNEPLTVFDFKLLRRRKKV